MSGAKNGLDTMTAEDTALMSAMRDEGDGPQTEVVEQTPPAPEALEAEASDDTDLDEAADNAADEGAGGANAGRATKRVKELIAARKAAETRATEAERARAVSEGIVSERLRLLTEAAQASMPRAPEATIEIPDADTDPMGHVKALLADERRQRESLQAIVRGFQESQRETEAFNQLRNLVVTQENEFKKTEPTYDDAASFLVNGRHAELEIAGFEDLAYRNKTITADMRALATHALQNKISFPELVFKLAKSRGFVGTAPKAAAPVVPPIDADTPLPERAARIESGRANSLTIANGGAAPPRALTPDRIAAMSDAEFAAHYEKISKNPAALRDLMGH